MRKDDDKKNVQTVCMMKTQNWAFTAPLGCGIGQHVSIDENILTDYQIELKRINVQYEEETCRQAKQQEPNLLKKPSSLTCGFAAALGILVVEVGTGGGGGGGGGEGEVGRQALSSGGAGRGRSSATGGGAGKAGGGASEEEGVVWHSGGGAGKSSSSGGGGGGGKSDKNEEG